MNRRLGLLVVAVALVAAACGSGGGRPSLVGKSTPTPTPPGVALVARVSVPNLQVFAAPGAPKPTQTFANPWLLNNDPKYPVPLVMLVEARQGPWTEVLLPSRPNGSTGWVHTRDVTVQQDPYRISVALAAHRLTVLDGTGTLLTDTIAVGAAGTPTPTGTYYIRVLLKAPDPTTVYGPYAYGLSGHSAVLNTFDGSDAELGIHGNNDASVLGTDVSHGCIRMSNDKITRLASILPLGTPVQITA